MGSKGFRACAAVATAALIAFVAGGAASTRAADTQPQTVISGHARFEVLSPTLIRMEYAGDDRFTDAATFNAIGRDDFGHTDYTTSTSDGWLTITTSQATLKYKVDSGPFTAQNVSLSLNAGGRPVTAAPAFPAATFTCAAASLCEGEQAQLNGVGVATDHTGFTGTGFAAGFQSDNNSLTYQLDVATAGTYDLQIRYANSQGGDGQNTTRTLTATIDGSDATLTLPTTANWDTWALVSCRPQPQRRPAHAHHRAQAGGLRQRQHRQPRAHPARRGVPGPRTRSRRRGSASCEAENGDARAAAQARHRPRRLLRQGFVAGLETPAAEDSVSRDRRPRRRPVPAPAPLRQRRPAQPASPHDLGQRAADQTLAPTADWDTWATASAPRHADSGRQHGHAGLPRHVGSCHVNVDTVAVTAAGAPAPLARTCTRRLPPRPRRRQRHAPPSRPACSTRTAGTCSTTRLRRCTTHRAPDDAAPRPWRRRLPGRLPVRLRARLQAGAERPAPRSPARRTLLPRWAYGVWYSRVQRPHRGRLREHDPAEVPRRGRPARRAGHRHRLQVARSWNGWEIDPAKFPDPKGFFDWAQPQGLHNTFNIHPSILGSDPQFAQAQATAKGKLTSSAAARTRATAPTATPSTSATPTSSRRTSTCTRRPEPQGVDFWWLDWCCDALAVLAGRGDARRVDQPAVRERRDKHGARLRLLPRVRLAAGRRLQRPDRRCRPARGPTSAPPCTSPATPPRPGRPCSSRSATRRASRPRPAWPPSATTSAATTHGLQGPGTEPGTTKLPDDLYARWVQFGTFQPIDRLHCNHSDRLPWQYGAAAKDVGGEVPEPARAARALHLHAGRGGQPHRRPDRPRDLPEYPDEHAAYATAGSEYFYGPDVLVAPVTTPGDHRHARCGSRPGSGPTTSPAGPTAARPRRT